MIVNLFIFAISLFLVIKGATIASKYAARLAESFKLPKYTVGFIVIAVISILPETFIAINSALAGVPSFGLGMLFGSNIADLTLVFAIIVMFAGRGIKIQSKVLKNNQAYPLWLLLPIALGLDGHYSRVDAVILIIIGAVFYYLAFKNSVVSTTSSNHSNNRLKNISLLLIGMVILLTGSHFTVTSASSLAKALQVSPILIGMLIVGLGTTMPELFFSLKSVKKQDDALAVGDILGTVLADATIVVGVIALISPFYFPQKIIYITGLFMLGASIILLQFMRSDRTLTKTEAYLLFLYWLIFVLVELVANQ